MFQFFKNLKEAATRSGHAKEWIRLQNAYADPVIELAKTKQAVIVSAASVVDRLWNGNGGSGWDESCEEDYIEPLRKYLAADPIFSDSERLMIFKFLEEIVAIGKGHLDVDGEAESVKLESAGAQVDHIVICVVEWCRRYPNDIPFSEEDEYHGHY